MFSSFVAIGDSFSEGVGDQLPNGQVRGWADLVATGLAEASDTPVSYANLAIRGRKLVPIIDEQLRPAIALKPQLLSFNGGGNDIMRPRIDISATAGQMLAAVQQAVDAGIQALLLSGANPSRHLPGGSLVRKRGNELTAAVRAGLPRAGVTFVDNWADETLEDIRYWSPDRMHLNAFGHARVASNVLQAIDVPVPESWRIEEVAEAPASIGSRRDVGYYREYVLPWIGRRLTGRSSGDGRTAKIATLTPVHPEHSL
jgi:lysophospholipase L1-like esterase